MKYKPYSWHQETWQQLHRMKHALPHAILLHGPSGTGKTGFAEYYAQSLLCEDVQSEGHACGACLSCNWFSQQSHPDYRHVVPASLEASKESSDESETAASEETGSTRSTREPSKKISIDQIRRLADFMNLSTHRQGRRLICIYPAESLTPESSNALLKILEEPPPGTLFLLVTSNINALLPTILSRCRKIALPLPQSDIALAWLKEMGVQDAENWLAEQGGAPVAALEQAKAGKREDMELFLNELAMPSTAGSLRTADKLQKIPARQIITWLQRWLYDLLSLRLTGTLRYFPRYQDELGEMAAKVDIMLLLQTIKQTNDRNKVAEHPLVIRLLIEDILLDYNRIFTGPV